MQYRIALTSELDEGQSLAPMTEEQVKVWLAAWFSLGDKAQHFHIEAIQ